MLCCSVSALPDCTNVLLAVQMAKSIGSALGGGLAGITQSLDEYGAELDAEEAAAGETEEKKGLFEDRTAKMQAAMEKYARVWLLKIATCLPFPADDADMLFYLLEFALQHRPLGGLKCTQSWHGARPGWAKARAQVERAPHDSCHARPLTTRMCTQGLAGRRGRRTGRAGTRLPGADSLVGRCGLQAASTRHMPSAPRRVLPRRRLPLPVRPSQASRLICVR